MYLYKLYCDFHIFYETYVCYWTYVKSWNVECRFSLYIPELIFVRYFGRWWYIIQLPKIRDTKRMYLSLKYYLTNWVNLGISIYLTWIYDSNLSMKAIFPIYHRRCQMPFTFLVPFSRNSNKYWCSTNINSSESYPLCECS